MKIDDELLEALGNAYRAACGRNDVVIKDGWIVTFEAFVRWFLITRDRRQVSA